MRLFEAGFFIIVWNDVGAHGALFHLMKGDYRDTIFAVEARGCGVSSTLLDYDA